MTAISDGRLKEHIKVGLGAWSAMHSLTDAEVFAAVSELLALREAVKPFAEVGAAMLPQSSTDTSPWVTAPDGTPYGNQALTFGDFRRAARAFSSLTQEQK